MYDVWIRGQLVDQIFAGSIHDAWGIARASWGGDVYVEACDDFVFWD